MRLKKLRRKAAQRAEMYGTEYDEELRRLARQERRRRARSDQQQLIVARATRAAAQALTWKANRRVAAECAESEAAEKAQREGQLARKVAAEQHELARRAGIIADPDELDPIADVLSEVDAITDVHSETDWLFDGDLTDDDLRSGL